ncbi:MAG: hypothetical protein ACPLPR_01235 [Bacillota bacterium]
MVDSFSPAFYVLKSRIYPAALKAAANLAPGKAWPGASRPIGQVIDFEPKLAVVGLMAYKVRWGCPTCGGNSASLLLPALCGVEPWDWPWPFAEPDAVPVSGARGMVRVFYLSYRPLLEKRCLPNVGVSIRTYPCECNTGDVKWRSSYFVLSYRKAWGRGQKQGIRFGDYLEACRRVGELFPELQKVQQLPGEREGTRDQACM